jgi:hypothetical protein
MYNITHVTECEDLLFTIVGFLGTEHLNLQQRISKAFLHHSTALSSNLFLFQALLFFIVHVDLGY